MKRYNYFFPAAFFGGFLLFKNGVPLLPIVLGCLLAALVMWFRRPKASLARSLRPAS
ncbi:MAG: hypothetical protein ABI811_02430 [Acidobacteriota bacterium]